MDYVDFSEHLWPVVSANDQVKTTSSFVLCDGRNLKSGAADFHSNILKKKKKRLRIYFSL